MGDARPVIWIGRHEPAPAAGRHDAVRDWLLGQGPRPVPARAAPGRAGPGRAALPAPPPGAALVVCGLEAWGPMLTRLLARRPDLRVLGLPGATAMLRWPEYVPAASLAAMAGGLEALRRGAHAVVVPDAATAEDLAAHWRASGPTPAVVVEPGASVLGGTAAAADGPLRAVPYVMAVGPLEARANTLLLLQLWRDGAAQAGAMPKLVLAGPRGAQVEEIAPLLDWNPALRAAVVEAPGLSGAALRHLLVHARALLAPDFFPLEPALLRDAALLGCPVLAAEGSHLPPGPLTRLDPLDGPGWHRAIASVAAAPAPATRDAPLPTGEAWRARILRHAGALA